MSYIGKTASSATQNIFKFVPSSSATTVTGADAFGRVLSMPSNQDAVSVFLNGILLLGRGVDYSLSTSTVTFTSAYAISDEIIIITLEPFAVADMVKASTGGTFEGGTTHNGGITSTTGTFSGDTSLKGNVVVNEDGASKDFRVEGDTKDNLLLVDGSADKVGINTSSPDALLDVEGTTDAELRITRSSASTATTFNDQGAVLNLHNDVNFENGYNGGASIGQIIFSSDDTSTGQGIRAKIGCTATTYYHAETLDFYVSPVNSTTNQATATSNTLSKQMTINGDGRIGIGDTGQTNVGMTLTKSHNGTTLKVTNSTDDYGANNIWSVLGNNTNDADCNLYAGYSSNGHRFFVNGDGSCKNATGTYTNLSSDERLKYDIKDANSQWDDIKQLKFRNFKKHDTDDLVQLGVSAQEAEKICPKLVMERSPLDTEVAYNSEFGTLYTKDDAETQDVLFTKDDQDVKDGKAKIGDLKTKASKNIGDVKEVKSKVKVFKDSILFWKTAKALQEAIAKIETLEAKVKALEEA